MSTANSCGGENGQAGTHAPQSWQSDEKDETSPDLKADFSSIAGKTEQSPSQYRQALQIENCLFASSISPSSMCGLPPGHAAEDAADRQSDAREVAARQDVAGHDLAGCEQVR